MVTRSKKEESQAINSAKLGKQPKDVISKLKNKQQIGSPVAGRLRSRNNVDLLGGLPPKHRDRKTIVLPQNESSSQQLEIDPDNSQLGSIHGDSTPRDSQNTSTGSIYGDNNESQVQSSGYSYCTIL